MAGFKVVLKTPVGDILGPTTPVNTTEELIMAPVPRGGPRELGTPNSVLLDFNKSAGQGAYTIQIRTYRAASAPDNTSNRKTFAAVAANDNVTQVIKDFINNLPGVLRATPNYDNGTVLITADGTVGDLEIKTGQLQNNGLLKEDFKLKPPMYLNSSDPLDVQINGKDYAAPD